MSTSSNKNLFKIYIYTLYGNKTILQTQKYSKKSWVNFRTASKQLGTYVP